ncbi:MAG: hypothetical protein OHK0052_08320 [Anaerolineales bacterium]
MNGILDTELKALGLEILSRSLGLVETERFIAIIQREKFDYTEWRQSLLSDLSIEEISHRAMQVHRRKTTPEED